MESRLIEHRGVSIVVSDTGEIHTPDRCIPKRGSIWHIKGRHLKPRIDKDGYHRVRINKGGKRHFVGVHRLVAIAFLPNPNGYPSINHKDENKTNNCVDNLEWCDVNYNNHYNNRYESMAKRTKQVCMVDKKSGEVLKVFESINKASEYIGKTPSNIGNCCHGRIPSAYGYRWRFV